MGMRKGLLTALATIVAIALFTSPLRANSNSDYAEVIVTQAESAAARTVPRAQAGAASAADTVLVTLDFSLRCPTGAGTRELFASIADTSRLEVLPAGSTVLSWTLSVPLRQLLWLQPITRSCDNAAAHREPDEVDAQGIRWYRMQAGTQAYATLTCADVPLERGAHSASAPVTIWLSCPAAGQP